MGTLGADSFYCICSEHKTLDDPKIPPNKAALKEAKMSLLFTYVNKDSA